MVTQCQPEANALRQRNRRIAAALTKLAAECHRAKWQFDLSEDYKPTAKVARGMIAMAFRELHRIGDIALEERAALAVPLDKSGSAT